MMLKFLIYLLNDLFRCGGGIGGRRGLPGTDRQGGEGLGTADDTVWLSSEQCRGLHGDTGQGSIYTRWG